MWSTVKGFGIVNKAEVNIFLELPCFFNDQMDDGNLMSGSSAFSKSSLNIWKFTVYVLLKPGLENFEHYFATVWDDHPYDRKQRGTKEPLDESERGEWKSWLKLNIQKTKIMASSPISSCQIDGETVADFIFGAPKSLQTVAAAMKLKDASLEEEMATHSSILSWRIPWTEELFGLQSMGSQESDMTEWLWLLH